MGCLTCRSSEYAKGQSPQYYKDNKTTVLILCLLALLAWLPTQQKYYYGYQTPWHFDQTIHWLCINGCHEGKCQQRIGCGIDVSIYV